MGLFTGRGQLQFLIKGLCSVEKTTAALKFLRKMKGAKGVDCKPNVVTYNTVIDALCKKKDMDMASNLFEEMTGSGIQADVITYSALFHGYSMQGRWREGSRILKEMVDKRLSPDVVTFGSLMHSLCKHGAVAEARKLFSLMCERGEKPT